MSDPITAARYRGRVVLVTGSGSGIGSATARRLAAEGAYVVMVDIDAGQLDREVAAVRAVAAEGGGAETVVLDVADAAGWDALAADVIDRHGRLDLLHSNAAIAILRPAGELDLGDWERQIAVNLTATFLAVRALIAELTRSRGSVVVTSSVHADRGLPGRPAYAASKGALLSLVRQLAVEYGPDVRVNAVVPGPIMSPAWAEVGEADRESSIRQTALARFGSADEVAAAVAFLGSADASFITGASLVVDGGWSVTADSA